MPLIYSKIPTSLVTLGWWSPCCWLMSASLLEAQCCASMPPALCNPPRAKELMASTRWKSTEDTTPQGDHFFALALPVSSFSELIGCSWISSAAEAATSLTVHQRRWFCRWYRTCVNEEKGDGVKWSVCDTYWTQQTMIVHAHYFMQGRWTLQWNV